MDLVRDHKGYPRETSASVVNTFLKKSRALVVSLSWKPDVLRRTRKIILAPRECIMCSRD